MVRQRALTIASVSLAVGFLLAVGVLYFERGLVPGDALTYLAAGERLNLGHPLYALSPGDRPVELKPPYWSVPLLSPPLVAVIWRPLAALPNEWGLPVWWVVTGGSIVTSIALLLRRRPRLTSAALLALDIPLIYEIGVANLNGLLMAGTLGAWLLLRQRRDLAAGGLIGLMVAAKLFPAILGWWLLTQRRWQGVAGAIAAGVAALLVGILGAGLDAHLDYLSIARSTATIGASDLSLAGLARAVGFPSSIAALVPAATLVLGCLGILVLRRRPAWAYALGVVTAVLGSPVVNINWYAYLLMALVPFAWPPGGRTTARGPQRSDQRGPSPNRVRSGSRP